MPTRTVDCLIVGAGLAGLHCALELRKKHPEWTIIIAEAYNYIGGRVVSYTPKDPRFSDITWENGAGRIHSSHKRVLSYIQSYNLPTFPISQTSEWRAVGQHTSVRDPWPALSTILTSALSHLSKEQLAASTIKSLLTQILGPNKTTSALDHFPYRAEVEVMRADVAINSLRHELHSQEGFVVVGGGLRQLIHHMRSQLGSHTTLLLRHRLTDILPTTPHPTAVFSLESKRPRIRAKRIILALHASALREIHPFSTWPLLRHVRMEPLTRIYAIFPTQPTTWFTNIPKTISNSRIRYFIPINPAKGVAMISYVEGRDTKRWDSKDIILRELRRLFPEHDIPEPLFFKTHPWTDGCSYWLPCGTAAKPYISEKELSTQAFQPFPKELPTVFVCGESFSTQQAWMEGALEHAQQLLETHRDSF